MTDAAFDKVLQGYRTRMAEEEALANSADAPDRMRRRDEFLLPVGEDVAHLLVDLVLGRNARTVVELGTSYGFSTLFLADAVRRTGGHLYTYDVAAHKQAHAREQLQAAGLDGFVTFRTGDAVQLLANQPGPVDFALLDIWKDQYVPCLHALLPLLADNGVVVADNMLQPPLVRPEAEAYRRAVRAVPGMQAVLLDIGQGIDIACKVVAPNA